jgi:hypothetical protein
MDIQAIIAASIPREVGDDQEVGGGFTVFGYYSI